MKKIIFFVVVIVTFMFVYSYVNADVDEIIIPDAAIRVRVIAHSNAIHDQNMKMKVKEYIEKELSTKLVDVDSVDNARSIISNEIDNLNMGIKDLFESNGYDMNFIVHYGDNFFPDKEYKGIHYKAGAYESLVVTIGDGNGDNWWCVLFPPLCLLDAQESNTNDVEYQFFVQKLIQKVFG